MSDTFYIKTGDTSPSLIYALLPTSVVLTAATVRFSMRSRAGVLVVNRASATIVTATVTPTVRYDWQSADTAAEGFYQAEFEVTYSGGAIETFPNVGYIGVAIADDIA